MEVFNERRTELFVSCLRQDGGSATGRGCGPEGGGQVLLPTKRLGSSLSAAKIPRQERDLYRVYHQGYRRTAILTRGEAT